MEKVVVEAVGVIDHKSCDYKGKIENGETVIGSCHEGKAWFKHPGGYELCPVCSRPVVEKVKRNPNIASRERETKRRDNW